MEKLPKELSDKLETIGNNPIEEPKVYELALANKNFSDIMLEFYTKEEIVALCEKHTLPVVIDFAKQIVNKVTSRENKDGSVKTTPNTENCNLPNIFQAEDFSNLQIEIQELTLELIKLKQDPKISEKKIKDFQKKVDVSAKKFDEKCLEISGIELDKLTDWEKETVIMQIGRAVEKAYEKTSLGKL